MDILGFELLFEVNENVCKIIDIFNKLVEMLKIFGLEKCEKYVVYFFRDWMVIGKFCVENGFVVVVRKFSKDFLLLLESGVCGMRKRY